MSGSKDTNPKDVVSSTKLDMSLVPSTIPTYAAMALTEGALKYGRYNWRIAGVRMSIYMSAMQCHIAKLNDGEWADPDTTVPHLASIIACAGIIADAKLCGKLTDDRPPVAPVSELIDAQVHLVAHLKELFKEHDPHQFTIEDSDHAHTRVDGRVLREVPRVPES